MKKLFIVTGEISGDRLGAWYVQRLRSEGKKITCEVVGGAFLQQTGATIYESIEKLNVVGIVEILYHIPRLLRFMNKLTAHIVARDVDEVILVDIPAFNLRLAKRLKKLKPSLSITYLSPPQLWIWGSWRAKTIQRCCDRVVVLYPFEVAWYQKRGITAKWYGYPLYNELLPHFSEVDSKEKAIAFILGSRKSEFRVLFPIFAFVARRFMLMDPQIKIVLPIAKTFSVEFVKDRMRTAGLTGWLSRFVFVTDEQEKYRALSKCCLAITKPGTVTLELALLGVPSLIIYKVSWISYLLAKFVVNVDYMGLPNLFLGKNVCKELLQNHCKSNIIFEEARKLYNAFLQQDIAYVRQVEQLVALRDTLSLSSKQNVT